MRELIHVQIIGGVIGLSAILSVTMIYLGEKIFKVKLPFLDKAIIVASGCLAGIFASNSITSYILKHLSL